METAMYYMGTVQGGVYKPVARRAVVPHPGMVQLVATMMRLAVNDVPQCRVAQLRQVLVLFEIVGRQTHSITSETKRRTRLDTDLHLS